MSAEYECMVPIDHTADHRIYQAGAIIKLDHLPPEKVKMLVDKGYVKLVKAEAKVEVEAKK